MVYRLKKQTLITNRRRIYVCLNPYFPGFIFLMEEGMKLLDVLEKWSQSLFSWIHLSYKCKSIIF